MRVNKISEIWVIWVLGVLIIFSGYFTNKNFSFICIGILILDLIIRTLRGTVIRNRRIKYSNEVVGEFSINKDSFIKYLSLIIIIICLVFIGEIPEKSFTISEYFLENIGILGVLYLIIYSILENIFLKNNNVILTNEGIIFPTGTFFKYSNIKTVEVIPYIEMHRVNIKAKGAFGYLEFRIPNESLNGVKKIKEFSLYNFK